MSSSRLAIVLLLAITLGALPLRSATAAVSAPATTRARADAVAGELLVTWHPAARAAERATERARYELQSAGTSSLTGVERVLIEPDADPAAVAADLVDSGRVLHAQPNYRYEAATADPLWVHQWGLHNDGGSIRDLLGEADVDVDAPEAWSTTRGTSSVLVAIIDTGVDVDHPDLRPNLWVNRRERDGARGFDDDGNGYVDDVHGWDFYNRDASLFDDETLDDHGTHVAGIVAAAADNRLGGSGVAPSVRILPLKFLGVDGGSTLDAIEAIAYASKQGADVINASWGNAGATDQALNDAIAASGAVFVAAAGNGGDDGVGDDTDRAPHLPASLPAANIVSVTAVDNRGRLAGFANHGATTVDVGAPGVAIASTHPGARYAWSEGTSAAAPFVSGVAALVLAAQPGLSAEVVADAVRRSARSHPLRALEGRTVTGGIVNAPDALRIAAAAAGTGGDSSDGVLDLLDPSPEASPTPAPAPTPSPVDGPTARTLDHACPSVPASGFVDVPSDHAHRPGIDCASAWGVYLGGGTGRFGPGDRLSRGQLASVLVRTLGQVEGGARSSTRDHFVDDDASVHEDAIDVLAELGIVGGVGPGRYAPESPVTRAQFASMLVRAYTEVVGTSPAPQDAFRDDEGSPHEDAIGVLAALGIVGGDGDGRFHPSATLTRGQSATMLARLLDALVAVGAARVP